MENIDWVVLLLFFVLLIGIGFFSYKKVKSSKDFFVGGGEIPWWLAGISHHVSGYSGVVFVAFAGLAYTHGISIYIWWALTISIGTFVGAFVIAPRWSKLRIKYNIQSPTEFLSTRYNFATQQVIAWSGVLLKLFDIGAKWAAIAIILNVFTGVSFVAGILLAGGISMIYVTVGGLWADIYNDFAQFIVQIIAGITMFVIIVLEIGGFQEMTNMWSQLPESNRQLFNAPYTVGFAIAFLLINFLAYNGGTWNLAMRFISSPSGSSAKKAALLSSILYLVWPIILFLPMWFAPILLPGLEDPTKSYALMAQKLLPPGLVGLVLAGMFANTMSMTASDSNTISSVITRDILPNFSAKMKKLCDEKGLLLARVCTFIFIGLTIIVAINSSKFGGVLGLIVSWFGALVGPVAIPMILGLLPMFKHSDSRAALTSILGGFVAFVVVKYIVEVDQAMQVAAPVVTSFIIFVVLGMVMKKIKKSDNDFAFFDSLE